MKLIAFFQGTDALLISRWNFPCRPYKRLYQIWMRIKIKLLNPFINEYWVDHSGLERELRKAGITKIVKLRPDELWYPEPIKKIKHKEFNILYYYPGDRGNAKLWRWVYGYDIYLELKQKLKNVHWIVVNGTADMMEVLPVIDFYLRPNRHDGASRLRQECEINNIPYYWTREKPNISEIIKQIEKAKNRN